MDDKQPAPSADADDQATVRAPKRQLVVVFKRYELLIEIGKGGMGKVWLARDAQLENSEVALKFLKSELASDPQALQDLKREVLNNRSLTHQNIIRAFSFESDETAADASMRFAISMEYIKGMSLSHFKAKREGVFDVDDVRKWMFQLCDAMQHAHELHDHKGQKRPIVHRDIKPANLMIHESGELKVCDFGIGCTVAETMSRLTNVVTASGTLPYMSPQQLSGKTPAPSHDIYSIGATLYELLTGSPPFFRGNSEALADQIRNEIPPSMAERRKELGRVGKPIPREWENAVAACLAKDPAARPPSARALRDMLEGKTVVLGGAKAAATRRRGITWAAAAAVVLLAGAGSVVYWKTSQQPPAPLAVVKPAGPSVPAGQPAGQPAAGAGETAAPHVAAAVPLVAAGPVQAVPVPRAPEPGSKPAVDAGKTPVDDLIDAGAVTREEGVILNNALRGVDNYEKNLATRLVIAHSLAPADWRSFSSLVPAGDENMAKLRPLLAAGIIRENEFAWLHEAVAGQKGDAEKAVAHQLLEEKTLTPEQWRTQTDLYPHEKRDPFMEKVQPLVAAGTFTQAEGQWLRDALAGQQGDGEKSLAGSLLEEKTLTPGQWRARTVFSYALKDDAKLDPASLPPAIDLPLSGSLNLRLLRIEPGAFVRGSPKEELGRRPNELPPERVTIAKPLYIGIYEVTQAQFTSIMPRSPSFWRGNPTWPIDQVDWQTVAGNNGFIAKLNQVLATRHGGTVVADLPSEDEWEYACRAGTQTSFNDGKDITNLYSDGALDLVANYNRAANGKPRPVGSYQPNAWGLYDMHGNISEWCQNRYLRGGSWQSRAADCRAGWRTQISSDAAPSNQAGFRLVLRCKDTPAGN